VHDGAMDDALEAGGRLGFGRALQVEGGQLVVDIFDDTRAQGVHIDGAGAHDGRGVAVIQKGQQQVLERCVLVVALVGVLEGAVQGSFKALRECGHGGPSLLFHSALQRMLVLACKIHHLGNFGLGNLIGKDAADTDAFMVYVQHDPGRFLSPLVEEALQYVHHELHRRVVIVQQEYFIKAWLLGFRARLGDEARLAFPLVSRAVLAGHAYVPVHVAEVCKIFADGVSQRRAWLIVRHFSGS
jgi:hypothetical protein